MCNEKSAIAKWNAEMYDKTETGTEDVDFALSVIGGRPGNILEIGCGSGRFLVPMARAGHTVTGLDLDEYMLEKIGPKAAGLRSIAWRRADVINDSWGGGFDAVLMAANFLFNIVSDMDYEEAQRLLIGKAARALVPGGGLYIDSSYTLHPEEWFNDPGENVVWEGTDSEGVCGRMTLLNSTFDSATGIVSFTRRFELTLTDGTAIREDIPSKKHFARLEQIHGWLSAGGFTIEEEYGGYGREPIGENTGRAIIWARKK